MSSIKGQGLGAQIFVVIIFVGLIALMLAAFVYPDASAEMLDKITQTFQNANLQDVLIFALITIVIVGGAILVVLLHFTTIFEEREV
jgi:uncharacterized membrane protein YidH (DUF202 family)